MNKQCKSCIHSDVCVYREHYEDAVELLEKVKTECSKYPYFVCDIRCIKCLEVAESEVEKMTRSSLFTDDSCENCMYKNKEGYEEPCKTCCHNYITHFKKEDKK